MTELPLALDRLRAAVNGDDFEWEIDGGSPFDDAKAVLEAYDEMRAALQKIADLVDSEAGEPLDDAIRIANDAIRSLANTKEIPRADRAAIVEECAKVLDDAAQDWRRIRDPGMANNAASYARKIRAIADAKDPGPYVRKPSTHKSPGTNLQTPALPRAERGKEST